jgi:hypothetical protein
MDDMARASAYLDVMDTKDSAQELLTAYGQIAGLPGLKFEPHGCARLVFERSVAVDLEIDVGAKAIQVYGVLGPVPAGDREVLYRRLLEANLFCTKTRGATLSVDAVQEEVILSVRVLLASATPPDFAELLEQFAANLEEWRQKFGSGDLVASARTLPAHDSAMGMFLRG